MMNSTENLTAESIVALSPREIKATLALIGDRADALLAEAAATNDDDALDEAWKYIDLYNKICARTSPEALRSAPKSQRRRKIQIQNSATDTRRF